MAQQNLKEFRHSISVLKKAGLVSNIDARKAQPFAIRGGKRLSDLVKKHRDLISDLDSKKVTPLKVGTETAKKLKKAGYETAGDRVFVPHSATERVHVGKDPLTGERVPLVKDRAGIEKLQLPVEYHNLEQYLRDLGKKAGQLDKMKKRGEYWGFKFYGNNSHAIYRDIGLMLEDLTAYNAVITAVAGTRKNQREVFQNLEIVRVSRPREWEAFGTSRRKAQTKERHRKSQQKYMRRLESNPARKAEYDAANRQRQAEYRDRLKGKAKQEYLKEARKRKKRNQPPKAKGKK